MELSDKEDKNVEMARISLLLLETRLIPFSDVSVI